MIIKRMILSVVSILLLTGCCNCVYTVTVSNPKDADRHPEMVEISLQDVMSSLSLAEGETFIVKDANGNEIPHQITYDGQVIFQVTMKAGQEQTFKFAKGTPQQTESLVFGKHYAGKDDDFAWENDKVAFRVYGHKQDVASGYDIFCKRGTHLPVLEQFYANEVKDSEAWKKYYELEAINEEKALSFKIDTISYHVDHGNGLDCYKVGPTLGCGTAALLNGDAIVYPYCWKEYEILENGPLRFTVKLTYNPLTVGNNEGVVETRVISLAKGSQLNKTIVSFEGLNQATPVATGLVIHPENPDAYVLEGEKGYIAYADLTDNVNNDNGVIYVGAVMPEKVKEVKTAMFAEKEAKERGASGHVLAISNYKPGSEYTYYWGSGWSKYGFDSMEAWTDYLNRYAQSVRNPLQVKY